MIRRFHVPFVFAGAFVLGACSGSPGPTDSTPAPGETAAPLTADPASPKMQANRAPEPGHHPPRGPHGPGLGPIAPLLDTALLDLDLSQPKADSVREIRRDLIKNGQSFHDSMHAIDKKLSVGLRAGEIDATSIQTEIAEIKKNAGQGVKNQIDALDKLHATLDASERHALVEAVRAHAPPDHIQGHMRGPKRPPNAPADGPPPGPPLDGKMGGPLLHGLNLTDAQLKTLEAALGPKPDPAQMRARFEQHHAQMEKVLAAFEKDDFRASSVITADDFETHVTEHLVRDLDLAKAALSVLTVDQRAELADRLERKGPPHPPMPPL